MEFYAAAPALRTTLGGSEIDVEFCAAAPAVTRAAEMVLPWVRTTLIAYICARAYIVHSYDNDIASAI